MEQSSTQPVAYSRKNPCVARLKEHKLLTEGCTSKATHHYEIDLAGSGLQFEPGDSLAIFSKNDPALVEEILTTLGYSGDETVTDATRNEVPIRQALTDSQTITQPNKKLLNAIVEKVGPETAKFAPLLEKEKKKELSDFLWGREVIDFLLEYPQITFEPQEFVSTLGKHNVRLYSIASSLAAVPDEVHLTVADVTYESFGRTRKGVCTMFLSERITQETPLACFITPGKGFRLPAPEEETPIIMIGPGTGIAPFRSFVQERQATNAKGKAWLFFGEIHEQTCFFYEDEWNAALKDGGLEKITTAFSRDQDHKIYVHHRMKEEAAELWNWLEAGAIFYVCGDAERMAVDVDNALHEIVASKGGLSSEEAAAYIAQMKTDKRYRRDVY